jgi:hypothetical protein
MALQGTLDTFELPDVLRLLASTRKSGRLHLRGDRGEGDVWLADGRVVGAEAGATADVADALFELLRAHEGTFAFEPGEASSAPSEPADVEPLLVGAEAKLVEWRAIEAVVPSLGAWVGLSAELAGPEVTVPAETWRLVATIGSGVTVGELGQVLGLGEVAVSRVVRDLVDLGLGAVNAPPAHAAPATLDTAPAPVTTSAPLFGGSDPVGDDDLAPVAAAAEPVAAIEPAPQTSVLPPEVFEGADPVEADEVNRQLAMLSPRAAQAVAAAAAAGSEAERIAALDQVDDGEEPVNRGLLLKFLSSVKT